MLIQKYSIPKLIIFASQIAAPSHQQLRSLGAGSPQHPGWLSRLRWLLWMLSTTATAWLTSEARSDDQFVRLGVGRGYEPLELLGTETWCQCDGGRSSW